MRASHILLLFVYIAVAIAGGYQGCLEKIWLFRAYEIDGLNPPAQQTLGWRCPRWIDHACQVKWEACTGVAGRCNFGEFVRFLGRANNQYGWAFPSIGEMNNEETARRCVARFPRAVYNAPPWRAMKNTVEYNDFINKVNKVVDDTWRAGLHTNNEHMWARFDDLRFQIIRARAGDHAPFLTDAAQANLGPKGIILRPKPLGYNPMNQQPWTGIDWPETVAYARDRAGILDADVKVLDFFREFYAPNTQAREHLDVINSYKCAIDDSNTCRLRAP
jgi:hypothetical protein